MRPLLFFVLIAAGIGTAAWLSGCKKTEAGFQGTRLAFVVPQGFPQPAYDFRQEPITEERFQLGRKLFYDGQLSKDGRHGCASCHQHDAGFTTYQHDRSHGYGGSHTLRNAPGLANLAWFRTYFLDGQYSDLGSVIDRHITRTDEMAMTWDSVTTRLNANPDYGPMFRAAFGDAAATPDRVKNALRDFLLSLVVSESRYDKARRGTASFSADEAAGYAVFQAKCASCHTEPLLSGPRFYNIGLPVDPSLNDFGRMRISGDRADSLKFRIPDLHNLPLTSYYTHDGRISDIRLVLRHYRTGVQNGPTTDPLVRGGIALSSAEEDQLVAFLFTLTDTAFMNNPRFKQ